MLYMIRSPEMDEAVQRGGYFEGSVGQLEPLPDDSRSGGEYEDDQALQTLQATVVEPGVSGRSQRCSLLNTRTGASIIAQGHQEEMNDDEKNGNPTMICIPRCSPFATRDSHEFPPLQGYWEAQLPFGILSLKAVFLPPLALSSIVVFLYAVLTRFRSGSETIYA